MTCLHENTVHSKRTAFCLDCDQIIPAPTPTPQTRYPRPNDNLKLGWHSKTGPEAMPIDADVFAAWPAPLGGWQVIKVPAGRSLPQPALYWHHDVLGVPLVPAP